MNEKVILFQGDSITDCGRDKNNINSLGNGYCNMVGAALGAEYPYDFKFYNMGINGNRIVDIYARIKCDIINLKPDYMSILIGINDCWHEYTSHNGVDADKFEMVYGLLIEEIKAALPNIKIMILEPFVLPGSATITDEEHPGRWEHFKNECTKRRWAAKKIAEKSEPSGIVPQQKAVQPGRHLPVYRGISVQIGISKRPCLPDGELLRVKPRGDAYSL